MANSYFSTKSTLDQLTGFEPASESLSQLDRELQIEEGRWFIVHELDYLTNALQHSTAQEVRAYIDRCGFTEIEASALLFAYEALQTEESEFEPEVCARWGDLYPKLLDSAHTDREHTLVGFADVCVECAGH